MDIYLIPTVLEYVIGGGGGNMTHSPASESEKPLEYLQLSAVKTHDLRTPITWTDIWNQI